MQVPLLKHLALCSEGALCPVGISGFDSMRALSRRSEKPELASCPWDKKRDGFVMSDGAKTERQIEILSKSKLEDCLKYENKIALELL